ncbi:outer membrane efflux protein [Clostridium puniceum]|uniref:Outer membrane efflux protein n=1 Tax=Clostridium puniceum TaxID=29367 RepID=A0A1S8TCY5_9CLOT|nr:TolC family protein [Clostridium puniceum]OOM75606.1 outer membrane efflux protein [Clostridium puniceum]
MRKNINKLIAFAIGMSVISGSAIPAFAAENVQNNSTNTINVATSAVTITTTNDGSTGAIYAQSQVKHKPVLTLQESIDADISNSDKFSLKAKEIELYEDKLDIQDEIDEVNDEDNDFPYDKIELMVDQSKEQKKYMEDQIAQDITNKYNDLITRENEISKIKKRIEIKTTENEYLKLKKDLGIVTDIAVKNAEVEFQKLKNSEKAKEDQLKNAKDYFKVLTDKDLNNYELQQQEEFKAFRIEGSQDKYFDEIIDKYYKYDKKLIELIKDNLEDNKVDRPNTSDEPDEDDYTHTVDNGNGTTSKEFDSTGYAAAKVAYVKEWADYGTYLESKYDYRSSKVSLEDNKKNLKNGLKESYASLLDMENGIIVAKSNIEVKNKELSIARLRYDEGLIIENEYNTLVLDNKDLETELRNSINKYNTLRNKIQKPWLLN